MVALNSKFCLFSGRSANIRSSCSSKFPPRILSASSITKYLTFFKVKVGQLPMWSYKLKSKYKKKHKYLEKISHPYFLYRPGVAITMWGFLDNSKPCCIISMPPTTMHSRKFIGFPMIWNWSAICTINILFDEQFSILDNSVLIYLKCQFSCRG